MMTDDLEKAGALLRRLQARQEARRRAGRFAPDGKMRPAVPKNRYIAEAALVREPVPGSKAEFWITYGGMRDTWLRMREDPFLSAHLPLTMSLGDPEALNGYVAFPTPRLPRLPRLPAGTGNIVQYIPVHGGVTWACKDSYAAVWGFDTLHANSEKQPRTDRDWIRANCWVLYRGLLLAEQLWPEFRRATQERRAELAQQILDLIEEQPLLDRLGFEAMIGMLFGRIG